MNDRLDRNAHCTHPEQAWCDCDWCRTIRDDEAQGLYQGWDAYDAIGVKPEPTPMEPPTPHTLHMIRARACGAYGFYATLSNASMESFGVEWLMSGLRAIHAQYLAEMTEVGCDEHGGFKRNA
jgi:hypothetical protein